MKPRLRKKYTSRIQNQDFLPFKMAAKILKLDLDQNIWFKCITSVYCCLYSALCSLQGIGLAFWDFTDNLLRFSGICLTTYKEIWKYFNIPNTYPQQKIRGLNFLTKKPNLIECLHKYRLRTEVRGDFNIYGIRATYLVLLYNVRFWGLSWSS